MIGVEQATGEDGWKTELLRASGPSLNALECQPWRLGLDAVGDLGGTEEFYVGKRHK